MSLDGETEGREKKRVALRECVQSGVERAAELAQSGKRAAEIQYEMRALVKAEMQIRKIFSDDEIESVVGSLCVGEQS